MNRVKFIVVQFPINSCHQRVVTLSHEEVDDSLTHVVFPINRCHQRVVTLWRSVEGIILWRMFPINRCHQRVVTSPERACAARRSEDRLRTPYLGRC